MELTVPIIVNFDNEKLQEIINEAVKDIEVENLIPHSHWLFMGDVGITKCNNCGWSISECLDDTYNYCPHCGAIMDEEEKNEQILR